MRMHWFVERGAQVPDDLLGTIEANLFAEENKGVDEFGYTGRKRADDPMRKRLDALGYTEFFFRPSTPI